MSDAHHVWQVSNTAYVSDSLSMKVPATGLLFLPVDDSFRDGWPGPP